MSFSQAVENLRCIYIYYIDRFTGILFKFLGPLLILLKFKSLLKQKHFL